MSNNNYIVDASNVQKTYRSNQNEVSALRGVDLQIKRGEMVAVMGPSGCRMGFVFQSYNLLPVLTSVQNVELPLIIGGAPRREARDQAKRMLGLVDLGNRLDHRPMELSGGEQQRVAIARALVTTPAIVWADEPTGNLDSERSGEIMNLLIQLNKAHDQAIIMVTHDDVIGRQAHRIVRMRDGQIESDEEL